MARISVLCICVCAVLLCSVFVNDVDAKRGFSFGRRKTGGSSSRRTGYHPQQYKPPPPPPPQSNKDSTNKHFLDAERNTKTKPQTNTGPVGFEHFQTSGNKPQTNSAPVGFENFQNPASKSQAPIGFESFNNKPRVPSAPAMPVPNQHVPSAPAIPNTNTGFNQPVGGGSFSSNQYPGKVNNPYQTNPNYPSDSHSNSQFKPSNNYPNPGLPNSGYPNSGLPNSGYPNSGLPNSGYPNSGFPNSGYPNSGFPNSGYPNSGFPNSGYPNSGFQYNPSQSFGNSYYNPNTGYQSFPNNYFGGGHYNAPNGFGNSYNPYGNNYFPGGGHGYSGYPGQFGYNDYKPKSKFGFGGLPIPIPIPIPIPLGGFGFGGLGGHRSNDNSHRVLNSLQNTTSLNSTANATSIYVVNNVTVVSCTNELFTYGPVNITVSTCTADNCTSVKVYMTNNSSVNQSVLTMCLGPNVTVTSNSSDPVKLQVSNISNYWHMVCTVTRNSTLNSTATNSTTQNATEPTITTTEANQNGTGNITVNTNSTGRFCEIFNCSYVEMCLPETSVDSNTKTAYRPCVRIKMCKSPNTPISHRVTLNTTVIRYEEVDSVINKTESYSLNNITVLAFYPVTNNCSANSTGNDTSCFPPPPPAPPITNTTDIVQANNNSTVPTCTGSDGTPTVCNPATPGNATSNNNSTSSISPELLKVLESEANKYNTSLGSLLQYLSNRSS